MTPAAAVSVVGCFFLFFGFGLVLGGVAWVQSGAHAATAPELHLDYMNKKQQKGWPTSLLSALNLDDLLQKWPREVLPLGAPVGRLTAAAAAHLGLAEGTLVAQGGADAFVGAVVWFVLFCVRVCVRVRATRNSRQTNKCAAAIQPHTTQQA